MTDVATAIETALDMDLPLAGVRVVELSQILAAPFSASVLGDFGADVVKIESPAGDGLRHTDSLLNNAGSAYFASVNRNKDYSTLDLRSPEGAAQLEELLGECDVFVTNMRPNALERARLTYEDLVERFPGLIYCSLTGFGSSGPRRDEPGMDIVAQALAGVMSTTGTLDSGPLKAGPPIADFAASLFSLTGILAALLRKQRTGRGAKVEVNLLDSALAVLANFVPEVSVTGQDIPPSGNGHPQLVPYQSFRDEDGKHFIVGILTEKFWQKLCDVLGDETLRQDPRFATNAGRRANRDLLVKRLSDEFATADRGHWITVLSAQGVPSCAVNTISEALADPQVVHNGITIDIEDPDGYGSYTIIGNPVRLDGKTLPVRKSAGPSR